MAPGLGLDSASRIQGADLIPTGTLVKLVMKIKPGSVGVENLCKRTAKGDAFGLDVEYAVQGGEYAGRKLYAFMLLGGTTEGHGKAAEYSRATLRAIFEAINDIDPNDYSEASITRRANATLRDSGFHGATFLATVGAERGGQKPNGEFYRNKNIISKVLRRNDQGYRKFDQLPPAPMTSPTTPTNGAAPAPATTIARPSWTE
jgi:hypothetical protein